MSDCIDSDLEFHGTKKGGTRKTVSKRKAYEKVIMSASTNRRFGKIIR